MFVLQTVGGKNVKIWVEYVVFFGKVLYGDSMPIFSSVLFGLRVESREYRRRYIYF